MNPTPPGVPERARLIEDPSLLFPPAQTPWWAIGLTLAILLAAAAALWWILRRRQAKALAGEPPHVTALRALEALQRRSAALSPPEYALQISAVLRGYIEARFGLRAPHRSTEEFLWEAERSPQLLPARRALVADFLRRCDRVKFALGDLSLEHRDALCASSRKFVADTIPRPENEAAPAGSGAASTAHPVTAA